MKMTCQAETIKRSKVIPASKAWRKKTNSWQGESFGSPSLSSLQQQVPSPLYPTRMTVRWQNSCLLATATLVMALNDKQRSRKGLRRAGRSWYWAVFISLFHGRNRTQTWEFQPPINPLSRFAFIPVYSLIIRTDKDPQRSNAGQKSVTEY